MAATKYHKQIMEMYGIPDVRVREHQRRLLTGLSRTSAWKMEKEGRFPKRKTTSCNHVTWSMAELMEWNDTGGAQ